MACDVKLIDTEQVLVRSSEKLNFKPNVTQTRQSERSGIFFSRVFKKDSIHRAQVGEKVKRNYHKMN